MAAKWPTASDEVARGQLVSLEGFPFPFHAKNGEWRDSHLGFQVLFCESLTSMAECADSTPSKSIERVCVSHRRSKFVYFVRKLSQTMILGQS